MNLENSVKSYELGKRETEQRKKRQRSMGEGNNLLIPWSPSVATKQKLSHDSADK